MTSKRGPKFEAYVILFFIETIFLLWFSLLPSVGMISGIPVLRLGDLEHFIAYFLYALTASRIMKHYTKGWKLIIIPFLIAFSVGGLCEIMQTLVPQRTGDFIDLAVNAFGSISGSVLGFRFKTFFLK